MNSFTTIPKFKFWCQKILPLVYDDSLSYMELLCKVIDYLNKVIEDINNIPDYINSMVSDEKLKEILSELLDELREQIARANEGENTTASFDRDVNELVWLDGKLVRMTRAILAGDRYVEDDGTPDVTGNFVYTSVEIELQRVKDSLSNEITARQQADEQLQTNIDNEILARQQAATQLQSNIDNEALAREQADSQLQEEIENITFGNTKYNVVDDMPSELENASLYEDIESDISYSSIPTSSVSEIAQKAINRIDEDNANGIFEIVSYNSANEPSVYHSLLDGFWKYPELKKALMSFGCNIALLQETVSGGIFNIENLVKSTLMKYSVNDDEMELSPFLEQCLTTFSHNTIISNQYIPFTNRVHNEGLQKSIIRIGNKIISVYNVHIYYVSGTIQDSQWDEMLSIINSDSNVYKLIGGDLNVNLATYPKVSTFEGAGYKVLNKGEYITYPSSNIAVDGFITTPNINVLEIELAENEFTDKMDSDHLPIRARLELV